MRRRDGDASISASDSTIVGSGDHSTTAIFTTASKAPLTSALREIDGNESRMSAACASKLHFKHSYGQSPEAAGSICKLPACSQPQVDPAGNSILHVFPRLRQSLSKLAAPCTCRTSERLTKMKAAFQIFHVGKYAHLQLKSQTARQTDLAYASWSIHRLHPKNFDKHRLDKKFRLWLSVVFF